MSISQKLRITASLGDICTGKPCFNVPVVLLKYECAVNNWRVIKYSQTGVDGTCQDLTDDVTEYLEAGSYKIMFDVKRHLEGCCANIPLFGIIEVTFNVVQPYEHYHFKVMMSSAGYFVHRSM